MEKLLSYQIKNIDKFALDLKGIVDNTNKHHMMPVKTKNGVMILGFMIRQSKKHGYIIVDTKINNSIGIAYSLTGAIAKVIAYKNHKDIKTVDNLDDVIKKNSIDCEFYQNFLKTSDRNVRKNIIKSRLEVAQDTIDNARRNLEIFIMNDIR